MGPPETLLQVLHLNVECEPKYLSCLHVSSTLPRKPHSEPHMLSMQCRAEARRRQSVQPHDCILRRRRMNVMRSVARMPGIQSPAQSATVADVILTCSLTTARPAMAMR